MCGRAGCSVCSASMTTRRTPRSAINAPHHLPLLVPPVAMTIPPMRSSVTHVARRSLYLTARLHLLRGEAQAARKQAEATIALSTEHALPQWLAVGRCALGWALAAQGQGEQLLGRQDSRLQVRFSHA
jgi:hypothetical protein